MLQPLSCRVTISVADFCEYSGLGRTKTFALIKEGKLEVTRIGRRTLISVESARRLITPEAEYRRDEFRKGMM